MAHPDPGEGQGQRERQARPGARIRNARRYTRSDIEMWGILADRLVQARTTAGYTQYELARRTRTSQGTISKIEAGNRPVVSAMLIRRFALALGVSADYLLGLPAVPARDTA